MENPNSVRIVEKNVTSVKSVTQEIITLNSQKNIPSSKAPKPKFLEHQCRGFSPSQPSKKTKKNVKLQRREPTEEEIEEAQRGRERDSRKERREKPMLRFTPYAWAKLRWCCHRSGDECGGFGITPTTPDLVEDFIMVKQDVTPVTVEFEDTAVADFTDDMVDRGLQPHQFLRIWIHTHPNMNPTPSSVDEGTFELCFGGCDYAIMFILSTKDTCYCRIQTNVGIPTELKIEAAVDYATSFGPSNEEAWKKEYDDNVSSCAFGQSYGKNYSRFGTWDYPDGYPDDDDTGSSWGPAPTEASAIEVIKEVDGADFFSLLNEGEVCLVEEVLKCEYKEDPNLWDLAASVMSHDDIANIDEAEDDTLILLVKEHVRGPELAALMGFDVGVGDEEFIGSLEDDGYLGIGGFSFEGGGGLSTGFVPETGDAVKILPAKETSSRFAT